MGQCLAEQRQALAGTAGQPYERSQSSDQCDLHRGGRSEPDRSHEHLMGQMSVSADRYLAKQIRHGQRRCRSHTRQENDPGVSQRKAHSSRQHLR